MLPLVSDTVIAKTPAGNVAGAISIATTIPLPAGMFKVKVTVQVVQPLLPTPFKLPTLVTVNAPATVYTLVSTPPPVTPLQPMALSVVVAEILKAPV